ncbi:two-component system sensor histidine kinase NtrB [Desulfovibrio gilichinskyi]|uniref:histidine kinase n=1 Tax=Desulfovibrio gilichinskyi TaxID=1519643 RepID=A0A1X7EIQ4_9BACT|nr:ATP-binding protein [Desulfovibrio gilichinskyi]SMF34559.1 Signal transduction histidine kinase [Desulfovibrio gilichinskyi]
MLDSLLREKHCDFIGILGNPMVISSLLNLLRDRENEVDDIKLVAGVLVDCKTNDSNAEFDIPIYEQVEEMLKSHPEITMLFELSGDLSRVKLLREILPAHISLVELPAARFFLKLQATDRLWIACKVDLMQTQALFKNVVDQLPEDILIVGSNGMIVDCNKHFSNLIGEDTRNIRGNNPLKYYKFLANVCPIKDGIIDVKSMAKGKLEELMFSEEDSEGKLNFYRIYIYPISDEQRGEVVQLVVMRRNITERTLMEQRVRQSERMATVGELAAYVAHEIRNPLVAMGGFAKVLMNNTSIDQDGHKKIGIIFEESKRLETLLKEVLSFVRSHEGEITAFNLNDEAESAVNLMALECKEKGIELELDLDSQNPAGQGGAEQVKQCLINLIMNAMEAMDEGGVIRVATGVTKDKVWLKVSDNGPGIPAAKRDLVFDPFYSTKINGNGLGLPMVKKIMEEFGGEIEMVSREGEGTTVSLILPPPLTVA